MYLWPFAEAVRAGVGECKETLLHEVVMEAMSDVCRWQLALCALTIWFVHFHILRKLTNINSYSRLMARGCLRPPDTKKY